jgi:proteasome accessory factor B
MADRVERLTNLLALLLEAREPLTLHVIAAELGGQYPDSDQARRASFERDKAALREIGVEISSVTLGGDRAGEMGYWVDRATYELPDLGLEPDEVRALQVALAMVLPELEALPVLRQAVAERHPVEFRYSGDERVVEPWGVLLRDGFWYLVGHDRMRAARRTFRIDRIEGEVSVLDDVIVDPPGDVDGALPSDPLLLGAPEHSIREAVVRIGARRAATVVAEVGSDRVQAVLADGGVEVVVRYASEVAMRSWVLGHLEDAVVIEPADLRESVVAWLEGCAR